MKNSKRFKDHSTIQKIGLLLMVIGAAIILAKIVGIMPENHFIKEDLPNYLFLAGAFLMIFPFLYRKFKGRDTKTISVLVLAFSLSLGAMAQDYSKQVAAFKQSFDEKSVEPIKPYVSNELKFDPIPVANTPAILNNIVSNLPKLNSISILDSSKGIAKVKYDFVGLGIRESNIHFDEAGKFVRIELIENLIKQEIEAQKKMKESVQLPNPGALGEKYQPTKAEFKTEDGLMVTGNLYEVGKDKPVILLCHQAGYNRMEYVDIAPKLNELGYNCLAIDQRFGGEFAGKQNETANKAKEKDLNAEMIDAQQDIKAAVSFLNKKYKTKVIVWGSSYSASLALIEGVSNDKVKAIIAFSPGDYFGNATPSLSTAFAKADKPYLVTSSKQEASTLASLKGNTQLKKNQSQYIPESDGFHGSRALWTGQKGAEEYWNSVITFLNTVNKN